MKSRKRPRIKDADRGSSSARDSSKEEILFYACAIHSTFSFAEERARSFCRCSRSYVTFCRSCEERTQADGKRRVERGTWLIVNVECWRSHRHVTIYLASSRRRLKRAMEFCLSE